MRDADSGYSPGMSISSFVARPLIAGMFVYGGLDAVRNPHGKVPRAEKVAPDVADLVGIDADTEQLVQFNGAVQVVAGITLALGIFPRVCRARPRRLARADDARRSPVLGGARRRGEDQQTIQFLKNAAMMGGLVLVVEHG